MQTPTNNTRISQLIGRAPYKGARPKSNIRSFGRKEKGCSASVASRLDFLNETFCEIPGYKIESSFPLNLSSSIDNNIDKLEKTAKRFCELREIDFGDFNYSRTSNNVENIKNLFDIVEKIAKDEGNEISIDIDCDNNFCFIEYDEVDYDYYTVYFLPCIYISKYDKGIRELLVMYLALITFCGDFELAKETYDFEFCLGQWDKPNEDMLYHFSDIEDMSKEYIDCVEVYLKGEYYELSNEIWAVMLDNFSGDKFNNGINKIQSLIDKAVTEFPEYGYLYAIMQEGLQILTPDLFRSCRYNPNICSDYNYEGYMEDFIDHSRMFVVTYGEDHNDIVAERALDIINSDGYNLDVPTMYDCKLLTPEDDSIFEPTTKLKQFCDWYNHFIYQYRIDEDE